MYQVGDACYQTPAAAAAAQASKLVGSILQQGQTLYSVSVDSVADNAINYVLTPVGGGASMQYAAPFTPQPCGLLTSQDALDLGWMVVGAWVAVYAVSFLIRVIRGETRDLDYGRDS